jgi:phosphoglycolate phosphatase
LRRLILFDVDGTLIKRGDPDHLGAMDHGVHSVFPDATSATVHHVDYDGKVDRLIATEILEQAGIDLTPDDDSLDPVFEIAGAYYRDQWAEKDGGGDDLLPGVTELVATLEKDASFALGVMTGGSYGVVETKLQRLELADKFPVGSFGNEVPSRPDLVPLALERAREVYGEDFQPADCVVVGDTPFDVHCAHVHGIACIGVATGKYSVAELRDAGADAVFEDLSDIDAVREALLTVKRASRPVDRA